MLADQLDFSDVDAAWGKRDPAHFEECVGRTHDLVAVGWRESKVLRALASGERSRGRAVPEDRAEAAEERAVSPRTDLISEKSLQKRLLFRLPDVHQGGAAFAD